MRLFKSKRRASFSTAESNCDGKDLLAPPSPRSGSPSPRSGSPSPRSGSSSPRSGYSPSSPLVGTPRRKSVFTKPSQEKQIIQQETVEARERSLSCFEEIECDRDNFRDEFYAELMSQGDSITAQEILRAWDPVLNGDLSTSKEESSNKLRFLIRKGVPDVLRPQVWKAVSGVSDFLEANPGFFKSMLLLVFGPKIPTFVRNVPSFGGVISPSDHYLAPKGFIVIKRLLSIVAMSFPDIDFCPALPDLTLICLMFLSEGDTCAMLHVILEYSKVNPSYYLNTSVRGLAQSTLTFDRLVSRHLWSLSRYSRKLGIDFAKDIAEPWFSRLFVSYLPYQTVLRVFDIYVNEGSKILYKIGLAILSLNSESLMAATSKRTFMAILHDRTRKLTDADMLIKTAYGFRMKDHLHRLLDTKAHAILQSLSEPHMPVYYRPRAPTASNTIGDEMFEILWSWVPRRFCIQNPVLIFSTEIHGCSLSTLYHLCARVSPSVLAVRTRSGSVFGAYVSDPWIVNKAPRPVYYGDGECFMFSLAPTTHYWPWTRENDYFMLAANDHIAVGGGSGSALWINHSFDFCMSSMSETFRNLPLGVSSEFLGAVIVEIFGFE